MTIAESRRVAERLDLELKRLCIAGSVNVRNLEARCGIGAPTLWTLERSGLVATNSGVAFLTGLGHYLIGDPREPEWPRPMFYQPPKAEVLNAFLLKIGTEVDQ